MNVKLPSKRSLVQICANYLGWTPRTEINQLETENYRVTGLSPLNQTIGDVESGPSNESGSTKGAQARSQHRSDKRYTQVKYDKEFEYYWGKGILRMKSNVWNSQTALRRLVAGVDVLKDKGWMSDDQHQEITDTARNMMSDIQSVSAELDAVYSIVCSPIHR